MTDIVTRIKNFGLGQRNRADLIEADARAQAAAWEAGDGPAAGALAESMKLRRRQVLEEAGAKARAIRERAAFAATGKLLWRPALEAVDKELWDNPMVAQLRHDALEAGLVSIELPADFAV